MGLPQHLLLLAGAVLASEVELGVLPEIDGSAAALDLPDDVLLAAPHVVVPEQHPQDGGEQGHYAQDLGEDGVDGVEFGGVGAGVC